MAISNFKGRVFTLYQNVTCVILSWCYIEQTGKYLMQIKKRKTGPCDEYNIAVLTYKTLNMPD